MQNSYSKYLVWSRNLSLWLFLCGIPATLRAQAPGQPDTVYLVVHDPSIDDSLGGPVRVEVWLKTDNAGAGNDVAGISLPVTISTSNPNSNPVLDTTVATTFEGSAIVLWSNLVHSVQVPPDSFPMVTVVGGLTTGAGLTAGQYLIATFVIQLSKTTTLSFDTTSFGEGPTQLNLSTGFGADYTPYWQQTDVVVPGYPTRRPPIFIRAHSPVNLIVTDPNGDSIGVDFNTIDSAFYDVLKDSIAIYNSYEGDYRIKVVLDTLDQSGETTYTIEARIDGTADVILVSDAPLPDSGQPAEIEVTN